ncbi:MAG TPA: exodeoxyribonuclease VII large subunit [Anaerolineaceae bacterium]|nr:exodeoxyribonuclease VII large subunit [Anaerolineaceae bacterium]
MRQSPLPSSPMLTVGELTRYLRQLFEGDDILADVWVCGEISNLSLPASGHVYLTLKDNQAALRCVIWKSIVQRLRVDLKNGQAVEVHGSIGIYEPSGNYQLYIDLLRPAGEGRLYQEYLRLKDQLEAEGLFAPERKRPVPAAPQRIGLVTSPTGAALQDILNTLRRRYPLAQVIVSPCAVQGSEAPLEIVAALHQLAALPQLPDVILAARGGGSLEDLWAFNDARVVRAIAASPIPVITGVGHETDTTLADYAADLRAPTPTAAAVLATPDVADLSASLRHLTRRLWETIAGKLTTDRSRLTTMERRLARRSPGIRLRTDRQQLDTLNQRTVRIMGSRLQARHLGLNALRARLEALNPQAVLARGYTILTTPAGHIVRSPSDVVPGQHLSARLATGILDLTVDHIVSEE